MNINAMTNYELIQQKELKDLKSEGYLLRHKKSGARVLLMENDDENKDWISHSSGGQYRTFAYFGAFGAVRIEKFSGKRSVCRACERIIEHIFECDDLPGQNGLSGGKLQ